MFARKLILVVVAAVPLALAAPALAQQRQVLMPGVTYEREVVFGSHGPVAVHLMTAPKPGGLWSVEPALSNGAIVGRERVSDMQRAAGRDATVAGVSGDFFSADGAPNGLLLRGGVLEHEPNAERVSIGVGSDGTLRLDRVRFFGRWWGTGQRRPLDFNRVPGTNGVAVFTPAWGPNTPLVPGAVEAVVGGLPAARLGPELAGTVASVAQTGGGTAIPRDGAVLLARGTGAGFVSSEAPVGTTLNVRYLLSPEWADVPSALGGGPVLVRDRKPVFRSGETFGAALLGRNPRAAIGQLADGRILLATVDGGQPGYSTGMTSFELAQTLVRFGAVSAAGLGVGPAATMAFEGRVLNRPPQGVETPVSDAVHVLYRGVYVAPPSESVLSPNGDGVGESQALSYKLPRAATVTAALHGPGGLTRVLDEGARAAGTYPFTWQGRGTTAVEREGVWRFRVTAVHEDGTRSQDERAFVLNRTLGALTVRRIGRRTLRASFVLTRRARVTATVRTRAGAAVATIGPRSLAPGRRTLVWKGRVNGGVANGGTYTLRVVAANNLGRSELEGRFVLAG